MRPTEANVRPSRSQASNTAGWIAALAVVLLILIIAFAVSEPRSNTRLACELKDVAADGWYRLEGRCSASKDYLEALVQFEHQFPNTKLEYMGNNTFVARR